MDFVDISCIANPTLDPAVVAVASLWVSKKNVSVYSVSSQKLSNALFVVYTSTVKRKNEPILKNYLKCEWYSAVVIV